MLPLQQLKWSRCQNEYQQRFASSNAVYLDTDAYIGISFNKGQPSIRTIDIDGTFVQVWNTTHVLPWSVERFALAAFKGALLVVGGEIHIKCQACRNGRVQ